MMYKVGLIGTPSCGKTTTAKRIYESLDSVYVPEVARLYISTMGRSPTKEDQENIAKMQSSLERSLERRYGIMVCDSPMMLCEVYNRIYGNSRLNNSMRELFKSHNYDVLFKLSQVKYIEDGVRFQTSEDLLNIDFAIDVIAPERAKEIIQVPFINLEDRVFFIINEINKRRFPS